MRILAVIPCYFTTSDTLDQFPSCQRPKRNETTKESHTHKRQLCNKKPNFQLETLANQKQGANKSQLFKKLTHSLTHSLTTFTLNPRRGLNNDDYDSAASDTASLAHWRWNGAGNSVAGTRKWSSLVLVASPWQRSVPHLGYTHTLHAFEDFQQLRHQQKTSGCDGCSGCVVDTWFIHRFS